MLGKKFNEQAGFQGSNVGAEKRPEHEEACHIQPFSNVPHHMSSLCWVRTLTRFDLWFVVKSVSPNEMSSPMQHQLGSYKVSCQYVGIFILNQGQGEESADWKHCDREDALCKGLGES